MDKLVEENLTGLRIPAATYRLQFTVDFGFDEARALIPYLHALGVTDLYASPLLLAKEGSEHGYDVTDPRRLDPGVGGRGDFLVLSAALRARDMGLLLDIVPNHMAASPENPWWRDVLRWGPRSVHATKFDIDWDLKIDSADSTGQLVLPILGRSISDALENGEIKLALGVDGFEIHYHEHHLPVCPGSYQLILQDFINNKGGSSGKQVKDRIMQELVELTAPGSMVLAGKRIQELYQDEVPVKEYVDQLLEFWNDVGNRSRFADLLARQHYRLVYWREAQHRINYRRFFDINDLVSLRIQDEAVFRAVHMRVAELAWAGAVTGLRIDHIDGLYDPEGYLIRLQEYMAGVGLESDPGQETTTAALEKRDLTGFYVLVEKILETGEELPDTWPVSGTTGYDFMKILNGLFVDLDGLDVLDSLYTKVTGAQMDFAVLVNEQKRRVMRELFPGEMANLAKELFRLASQDPWGKDLALESLKAALEGTTAAFPAYRTYTREFAVSPRDRKYIERALVEAAHHRDGSEQARNFLRRVLLLDFNDDISEEARCDWLDFVMRWQQFTGPIMAKGYEDTALYLYNRFVSLNEVGGDPVTGVVSTVEFHDFMQTRFDRYPHTMNATSTHDTKRSEDVRARLNVLSEIPNIWAKQVGQWREWNAEKKLLVSGRPVPDDNAEFLIYQTLVGAWPLRTTEEDEFIKRLKEYLVKASREAKVRTSWLNPDEEFEEAICEFVQCILEDTPNNLFRQDLQRITQPIAYYGALNSLAQTILKIVCPGVPDFYQGSELWDFSLVDPDNRRPVDFERRMDLLAELQQREVGPALVKELLTEWSDGRVKLYVTWKALGCRRAQSDLFLSGKYIPLNAEGSARDHVCALARQARDSWILAIVPRLSLRLITGLNPDTLPETKPPVGQEVWGDTVVFLPATAPDCWRNVFTGETVSATLAGSERILHLTKVLGIFPVALLEPEAES